MGCICCPLGNFVSSLLYAIERISTCAACAALVCCMLFTIVVATVFGVALGYHFCVVEQNAQAMDRSTLGGLESGAEELGNRRAGGGEAAEALAAAQGRVSAPNPESYKLENWAGLDRRRSLSNDTIPGAGGKVKIDYSDIGKNIMENPFVQGIMRRFKRTTPSDFNATIQSTLTNVSQF